MPTKRYKSARAAAQFNKKKSELRADEAPSSPTTAGLDMPSPAASPSDSSVTPLTTAKPDTLPSTPFTEPSSNATPVDSGTELVDPPTPYELPPPVTAVATPRIELTPKNAAFFAKWLPQFHAYVQAFPDVQDYEAFPAFCHRGMDLLIAFTRDVTKEHITKKALPHDEMLTPPNAPAQENIFTNPFFATDKIKNFLDINFERWRLFMHDREELEGRKWEEVSERHQADVKELLERVERQCQAGAWERHNRKVKELKREGCFGQKYVPVKKGGREVEELESGEEGGDEGEKKVVTEKKSRRKKKKKEKLVVMEQAGDAEHDGSGGDITNPQEVGAGKEDVEEKNAMVRTSKDEVAEHAKAPNEVADHEQVTNETAEDEEVKHKAAALTKPEQQAAVQQDAMRQHISEKRNKLAAYDTDPGVTAATAEAEDSD